MPFSPNTPGKFWFLVGDVGDVGFWLNLTARCLPSPNTLGTHPQKLSTSVSYLLCARNVLILFCCSFLGPFLWVFFRWCVFGVGLFGFVGVPVFSWGLLIVPLPGGRLLPVSSPPPILPAADEDNLCRFVRWRPFFPRFFSLKVTFAFAGLFFFLFSVMILSIIFVCHLGAEGVFVERFSKSQHFFVSSTPALHEFLPGSVRSSHLSIPFHPRERPFSFLRHPHTHVTFLRT